MTYRFVVFDIEKSLKQNFDDANITTVQILYWVQVVANNLRSQLFKSNLNEDPFVSTFSPVEILVDSKGRKYIDLPTQILGLKYDAGIVFVTYNMDTCTCEGDPLSQIRFNRTTIGSMHSLYKNKYYKPTPKVPYYYRVADRVNGTSVNRLYLLGIECIDVKSLEIGLLTSTNPSQVCNLDDEIPLPDEMIFTLITEVLKLGRFVLMVPNERLNDGDSSQQDNTIPSVPNSAPQVQQIPDEEI